MMKNFRANQDFLLATDLASETNRAFGRAVKIASSLTATLHIVHVCPLYSFSNKKEQIITVKQDAENMIKTVLAATQGVKKIQMSITVIEGGEVFAEIINHTEKVKAGLIVMGMHRKDKLRDMFVGTTIERIIRKGIKPVLMVRDKPLNNYKNVLVGMDYSQGSQQAFHLALELAPKSVFHLIHSYRYIAGHMPKYMDVVLADLAREKLEKFFHKNKRVLEKYKVPSKNFHFSQVKGGPYSCLIHEAAKVKSELIALGTHSNMSLMPYKLGGTASDILSTPPCDVLIAKGL
ncbi:MAG: universal stress protein E [Desulforhopalus sp.]|jgi:universal stress protein E